MPSEDPVMVSISSAGLSPDEISRRTFPTVRRGADSEAVRRFLEVVAGELRELHEREQVLRRRLQDAERRAAEPELDEQTLLRAVGAETARILQTAHGAAADVVAKAEASAAQVVGEAERVLGERTAEAEETATGLLEAARAEVDRLGAEAAAEAAAIREAAEQESEAVTEDARAEAIELLDATRAECRRIVREARRLRSSVLVDLADRRTSLRIQLEQLRAGRDSLLEVVDAVGVAVDELHDRLDGAEHEARVAAAEAGEQVAATDDDSDLFEHEPELAVDLGEETEEELAAELKTDEASRAEAERQVDKAEGEPAQLLAGSEVAVESEQIEVTGEPETGPFEEEPGDDEELELLVDEGLVGELGDRAVLYDEEAETEEEEAEDASAPSHRSVDELFARIRASRAAEEAAAEEAAAEEAAAEEAAAEEAAAEEAVAEEAAAEEAAAEEAAAEEAAAEEAAAEEAAAGARAQDGAAGTEPPEKPEAGEEPETSRSGAEPAGGGGVAPEEQHTEEVAVLEASTEASPAADGGGFEAAAESNGADAGEALARRAELLSPVTTKLSRALKRALQDDQNLLLDALRQVSGRPELDDLLPAGEQRARLEEATAALLKDAWTAGHAWLGGQAPKPDEADGPARLLASDLASEVSRLLRHRLEEALAAVSETGEGGTDAASAAYREWRGSRVESSAGDFATRAFANGAVTGGIGTEVRWVVDDEGHPCPDCDDNALAGTMLAGEEFPTGQLHPPVHPGCRCLLVLASS